MPRNTNWEPPALRRKAERAPARRQATRPGERVLMADAVEAMLRGQAWGSRQLATARANLTGGNFRGFCDAQDIVYVDQLTDAHIAEFLAALQRAGRAPATLIKYRQHFMALERFLSGQAGYGGRLKATASLPKPKVPRRNAEVIEEADEPRFARALTTDRDRLILDVLLDSGLRPGELCGLRVEDVHTTKRPAFLDVRRSRADTDTPKDREERSTHVGSRVARLLTAWIEKGRPDTHRREVFLSSRRDKRGLHQPLSVNALQGIFERASDAVGVKVTPQMCRHTWATRCANAGVPPTQLMQAGGWSSLEMVRRYYRTDRDAMLRAFEKVRHG